MSLLPPPSRSIVQSRFGAESVYLTPVESYLELKRVRPSKSSSLVEAFQAVVAQSPPWYLPGIAWLSAILCERKESSQIPVGVKIGFRQTLSCRLALLSLCL
jgi:hypothetical protein